ncbi:hypothetical protein R3W88_004668 [Solanum pinnatisectum]|uniref:F-box domain-containing protein n=1 Tax=Solanum pinnatisectum TaxID=50273 RepID=A0AAV9K9X2_9SOLN|nr:hypothetical protein R3W88_004668 [Solanum pinnatisectum]
MDSRSKIRNFPEDIVYSILLELPVKSLSRFKSCCKSWHCCIDDPDFINRQKIIFVNLYPQRRARQFKIVSTEASIRADSKVVCLNEPNIPGFFSDYFYLRVFSCSGLVFMTAQYPGNSMTLWNPAVGNTNSFQILFSRVKRKILFWYLVICVHQYLINMHPRYIVEVYSVKNQCWRIIHNIFPVPNDLSYLYNGQVSLNGVIHRMSHNGEEYKIISFHLADEKFTVTPMPSTCGKHPELHAWEDRVCVFTTVDKEILVWSLEKDRKTALLTWNYIDKLPTLFSLIETPSLPVGNFICIKENGNILWRRHEDSFIEYDLLKNEYTEFMPPTQVPNFISVNKALYVESLVSLKISWD